MLSKNTVALLVLSALCLGSAGCGAGGLAAVRKQASEDMQCPEASIEVVSANATAGNPTDSGLFYAEGCQKLRRYAVGCNIFGYCPDPQGVDVLDLIQRQAGFDLRCAPAEIAVQRLNVDTFGATGCGRQASYLVACRVGGCRVVQNTQSQ